MKIWRRSSKAPVRIPPKPGQESVWDYPRPPRVEECPNSRIRIFIDDTLIVDSFGCCRVLETSHPPVYYIPLADLHNVQLIENQHRTWCEWKGEASYVSMRVHERTIENAGWFYPDPHVGFESLIRKIAFYPSKMDRCLVNDDVVKAQTGDFYGGWITKDIVGPFKGGAGTHGW